MSPSNSTSLIMDTDDIGKFPQSHLPLSRMKTRRALFLTSHDWLCGLEKYTWSPYKSTTRTKEISKQRSEGIADGRDKIAIIQPVLHQTWLVQCKVIREPESRNAVDWHGVRGGKYILKTPGNAISETFNFKMSLDALALKSFCLCCEFQSRCISARYLKTFLQPWLCNSCWVKPCWNMDLLLLLLLLLLEGATSRRYCYFRSSMCLSIYVPLLI